jgi:hypothetical protein
VRGKAQIDASPEAVAARGAAAEAELQRPPERQTPGGNRGSSSVAGRAGSSELGRETRVVVVVLVAGVELRTATHIS